MNPKMTVPFVSQGGKQAVATSEGLIGFPITVAGDRNTAGTYIKGPALYARRTASPYKAVPFAQGTAIINPTNTTNATVDVADADAVKFKVGDSVTFYNHTTGAFSSETKVISAIGAPGSGGTGETLITLTGTWTTPPVANNVLCVADGSQLSVNCVVVLDDVYVNGADQQVTGYTNGIFYDGMVAGQNSVAFDNTKCPNLQFLKSA